MNPSIPTRHLEVENRPTSVLVPYANNARTHPEKQIRKIADSLRTYGWTLPILRDALDNVIAGHARLAAAKLLGLTEVPTIRLEGLTEQRNEHISSPIIGWRRPPPGTTIFWRSSFRD